MIACYNTPCDITGGPLPQNAVGTNVYEGRRPMK